VQGYSPLGSGLRILPWTLAPMFIAPLAGALSDRIPAKTIIGVGLAMQAAALAWIGIVSEPDTPYSQLVAPFVIAGVGMAMFSLRWRISCFRGAAAGGGHRLWRQQRHPRARRRLRRRGASVRVRQPGRPRERPGVDGMSPAILIGAGVVGSACWRRS
jgi:MFS family permease